MWLAWIERAKPIAYGEMGLKPWELGALTVREFNEMAAGYSRRLRERTKMEATWVSVLLNGAGHLKKPITRDELLGWKEPISSTASTPEARREAARQKRIEARRERARTISRRPAG